MSAWSMIVEHNILQHDWPALGLGLVPLLGSVSFIAFLETGGLFRIAVKLMMACSTTNSDMCGAFGNFIYFNTSITDRDFTAIMCLLSTYLGYISRFAMII